jgi:hypothetical protein
MLTIRLTKIMTLLAFVSAGTWLVAGRALSGGATVQEAPPPKQEQKHVEPAAPADDRDARSSAISVPLPQPATLHRLLRRAAEEAVSLSQKRPDPLSWTLTTIATAQAKSDDRAGARETFRAAAREAGGDLGGTPDARNLWRVAHFQAEAGLRDDSGRTLRRALDVAPDVGADISKDIETVLTIAEVVDELAHIGARDDARRAADKLQSFADKLIRSTKSNVEAVVAHNIAAAMAAVDDFDAAFQRAGAFSHESLILGEAAWSAARNLDRESARRFVEEADVRMSRIDLADEKCMGLGALAKAQARIGEIAVAKRTARSIGVGRSRVDNDMTGGQPSAMIGIANVQLESGDVAGARETLREGNRMIRDHPGMSRREGRSMQIAWSQVACGDTEGALITARSIPEGECYQTLALIARAQAVAGDRAAAKETMDLALKDAPDAVEARQHPSFVQEVERAEILAMAGDVAGALKIQRAIRDELDRCSALERLVRVRAAAGDVAEALRLALEEPRSPSERRSALQGIGRGIDDRFRLESSLRPAR